jgi:hypothetical protein
MDWNTNLEWRDQYALAMLELDPVNLMTQIDAAEAIIQLALEQQARVPGARRTEELQALKDAMHNLRTLRRVELNKAERDGSQISFQINKATS